MSGCILDHGDVHASFLSNPDPVTAALVNLESCDASHLHPIKDKIDKHAATASPWAILMDCAPGVWEFIKVIVAPVQKYRPQELEDSIPVRIWALDSHYAGKIKRPEVFLPLNWAVQKAMGKDLVVIPCPFRDGEPDIIAYQGALRFHRKWRADNDRIIKEIHRGTDPSLGGPQEQKDFGLWVAGGRCAACFAPLEFPEGRRVFDDDGEPLGGEKSKLQLVSAPELHSHHGVPAKAYGGSEALNKRLIHKFCNLVWSDGCLSCFMIEWAASLRRDMEWMFEWRKSSFEHKVMEDGEVVFYNKLRGLYTQLDKI